MVLLGPFSGGNSERPVDKVTLSGVPTNDITSIASGEQEIHNSGDRLGGRIRLTNFTTNHVLVLEGDSDLFLVSDPNTELGVVEPSNLLPLTLRSDVNLKTTGEIFQVPFVGSMSLGTAINDFYPLNQNWYEVTDSAASSTTNIERGRLDPAYYDAGALNVPTDDRSFYRLVNYLTVF